MEKLPSAFLIEATIQIGVAEAMWVCWDRCTVFPVPSGVENFILSVPFTNNHVTDECTKTYISLFKIYWQFCISCPPFWVKAVILSPKLHFELQNWDTRNYRIGKIFWTVNIQSDCELCSRDFPRFILKNRYLDFSTGTQVQFKIYLDVNFFSL